MKKQKRISGTRQEKVKSVTLSDEVRKALETAGVNVPLLEEKVKEYLNKKSVRKKSR